MSLRLETNAGTVTTWLPLTTPYSSISGCANAVYSVVPGIVAFWDPSYGINVNANLHCQPSEVTSWWISQLATDRFSIGPISCPAAYTTAITSVKDPTSTFVACCPIGFTQNRELGIREAGNTGECTTVLDSGFVMTYGVRVSQEWTTSTTTIQQATTAVGIQINGWVFSGDIPVQTPSGSSSISGPALKSSSMSTSTSMLTSISSNSTIPPNVQSNIGNTQMEPSIGISAGIGVGAGLGTMLVLGFLIIVLRRVLRHRGFASRGKSMKYLAGRTKSSSDRLNTQSLMQQKPTELPQGRDQSYPGANPLNELDAKSIRREFP